MQPEGADTWLHSSIEWSLHSALLLEALQYSLFFWCLQGDWKETGDTTPPPVSPSPARPLSSLHCCPEIHQWVTAALLAVALTGYCCNAENGLSAEMTLFGLIALIKEKSLIIFKPTLIHYQVFSCTLAQTWNTSGEKHWTRWTVDDILCPTGLLQFNAQPSLRRMMVNEMKEECPHWAAAVVTRFTQAARDFQTAVAACCHPFI